ncbi:MAG: LamG-like jellyroll fold domain-containing protein [Thiotrichaceae bacterium]
MTINHLLPHSFRYLLLALGILLWLISAPILAANASTTSAYWLFDEKNGNTANDTHSKQLAFTLNNMSDSNWIPGKSGSALSFNGINQDATIVSGMENLQTPSITFSAWIKPDKTDASWEWVAALGDNLGVYFIPQNRKIVFYVNKRANNQWNAAESPDNSFAYNEWIHIAGSYDAESQILKTYINGAKVASTTIKQPTSYTPSNNFTLGSMQGQRFFTGSIDEVQLINHALSDAAIMQLFTNAPSLDTFTPIITLKGSSSIEVLLGTEYIDKGATVTDNIDESIKVNIDTNSINTKKEGKYSVQFSAADKAGNTAKATRTVQVVKDRSPVFDAIYDQTVFIKSNRQLILHAQDADKDKLTFSSKNLPSFITLKDNNDGTSTLNIAPDSDDIGSTDITITVSSNKLSTSRSFKLQVVPVDTLWSGPHRVPNVKSFQRPDYLKASYDPIFGYRIKRITDAKEFSKQDLGAGEASSKLRHHYATSAVWNSDSSKYLLNFGQIRETKTNKLVLIVGKFVRLNEYIWSKVNPDILYGSSNNSLIKFNIQTKKATTLHTFDGFSKIAMDNLKLISDDDKYIVISDVASGGKRIAIYDIQNDRITWHIDDIFINPSITKAKHRRIISGISPSGKYVVMIDNDGGTYVFDHTLKYLRTISTEHQHADIGYDIEGNEVLVQTCPAAMIRLDNGKKTDLLGTTFACGHVSTRNFKQPGWAYFSITKNPNDNSYGKKQTTEVVAVRLDSSGTNVRKLVHPRSTLPNPSFSERYATMAVPNPEGTKLIFNSSWDNPEGGINAYIVDLAP